jgi:uncharacterized protein YoxC
MKDIFGKIIAFLITIILGFVAWQSRTWTSDIKSLSDSVTQLNSKMEVLVVQLTHSNEISKKTEQRVDSLEKTVSDHETRIRIMEKK